jgi:hypothetical protein
MFIAIQSVYFLKPPVVHGWKVIAVEPGGAHGASCSDMTRRVVKEIFMGANFSSVGVFYALNEMNYFLLTVNYLSIII